ncbi:hypothetical protein LHYA1_G005588 [Lachnellula hyalina]|uniref:FAD-binding domain-containing protein n=1 Tax=Lachnellula hyalina TaxID=1316788 RepID=A0A8H8R2I3_9HELO|nr:uncharacterized protein LHYA1_G005588 [Lachnellula hyalina]TVY26481.1 hypothetical protein LHYA1_G005588 [Lachnellula hyalina]
MFMIWQIMKTDGDMVDMHAMLMDSAVGESHEGIPAVLKVNHKCTSIDHKTGVVTFSNGVQAQHDLIIGADGIGSTVRTTLGIVPDRNQSTSHCLHCIISTEDVKRLGLLNLSVNEAIEYWGGQGIEKIVYSPCREGQVNSFYCFFPTEIARNPGEGWTHEISVEELLEPFGTLDPKLYALFENSTDIKPWRLFYSFANSPEDISKGLHIYEQIRKPRASKVQTASARAREDITERIGFSSNTTNPLYKVKDEKRKLTIEEMNEYDLSADIETKVVGIAN